MKGDFRTLVRNFCLESSIQGLKYFVLYPDPLSRCFWAVSMLVTLSMSFALTLLLYNRFADVPTSIAIENQYAPIGNVSFPAITICSPNQITISAMRRFERTLVDGNITMDLKNVLPRLLGFYELYGNTRTEDLNNLQNLIFLNRYNALEVMALMPQSCNDFIKVCYFKNKPYQNGEGLFRAILTKHGMCCTFNSIYHYDNKRSFRNEKLHNFTPYKAITGGSSETLTVVTDYDPANALKGTLVAAGAVRVMFTDSSEFPADDMTNLVNPYSESFHHIFATHTYCSEEVSALPYWSRQCYFEDEEYLPYFGAYRNSDCDMLCYVRAIEHRCHCTIIYMPNIRLNRACNITNINCIVQAKLEMHKWHRAERCMCLRDCVSTRYHVDMSIGNLLALPDLIVNIYPGIIFNRSTSILHFNFGNSVHSKQKQETVISLINLSSNLGGVFGLCMGCSVMSVMEIIFYIYCAVKNRIRARLEKVRKNKVADTDHKERDLKQNKSSSRKLRAQKLNLYQF